MKITLSDLDTGSFEYRGKKYYIDSVDFVQDVVDSLGMIEDDYVDSDTYEGSPYKTYFRTACKDDVNETEAITFIEQNQNLWKLDEN